MSFIQAVFLGLVQGLTEFLPVSSSGHLAIFKYIFGLSEIGITFDVLLHVGTLLAVFVVYRKDIWKLIVNGVSLVVTLVRNLMLFFFRLGKDAYTKKQFKYYKVIDTPYKKFVTLVIVSSIPVGIAGFLLDDYVEKISAGLLVPGICLLITGVLLLLAEAIPEGTKKIRGTSYLNAVVIGIAQACAIFPGLSRSGCTISASMMSGLKKEFAVKYSFIMSIPAILGAALKSLLDIIKGDVAVSGNIAAFIVGMLVAAVVGYFAIKFLLVVVKKRKFKYFSFYCFLAGLVAIIGFFVTK